MQPLLVVRLQKQFRTIGLRAWTFFHEYSVPDWLALAVALVVALAAIRSSLLSSWTPSDDGVLAQSAERVMRGELPHRDFIELWSGGLDYLNALAFRLFGVRLATLRFVLAGAWLLALSAAYAIARHFLKPVGAATLTITIALLTLPWSPHPLPSWYNLFFALGGTLAVLEYERTRLHGWLIAAGIAAGLSCAVKVVGLYFIAAVLMFTVWHIQDRAFASDDGPLFRAARPYRWFVSLALLLFLALIGALVQRNYSAPAIVHFLVPHLLLVALLFRREWNLSAGDDGARFKSLFSLLLPFFTGVGAVIAIWLIPYARAHALGDLVRGLLITPQLRFEAVTYPLPGLTISGLAVAPLAILLGGAPFVRRPLRRTDLSALAAVTVGVALLIFDGSPVVIMTWNAMRLLTPLCVGLSVWWLMMPPVGFEIPREDQATLFFLCAVATTCSLVQIPFALYTYFLYFLPLIALATAALVTLQPAMPRAVGTAVLSFVLFFGLRPASTLRARPNSQRRAADATVPLALARAGILVSRDDSTRYVRLIHAVQLHVAGGALYVWHDMPELYFLSALPNPTRTMFELFDAQTDRDPTQLRMRLETRNVRVIVLSDPHTAFTPMSPRLRTWIVNSYPHVEWIDSWEVRWR